MGSGVSKVGMAVPLDGVTGDPRYPSASQDLFRIG
jgi:hypothetical protein